MCQSSLSLLVVIAKVATCFPQHFIPHSFMLLQVSCGELWQEVVYFYFWIILVFLSTSQLERVGTFVHACAFGDLTASLIDTCQQFLLFENVLQPSSSLHYPLKVGCVPDETHKTASSASVGHLPFIIWLRSPECTMMAPKGFKGSDQLLW